MRGSAGAIGALLLTSVLWGTTGTAATFVPQAGPLAIGAASLGIGGILLGLVGLGAIRRERAALRARSRTIVLGAFAVAIYPLAFYASMDLAGVAIGTVVSLASAPVFAGIAEWVRGTPPTGRWLAAASLGIVGSALLSLTGHGEGGGQRLLGVGLGLLAGATYAAYSASARRLMAAGISRGASMGSVFGLGGLALMPVLLLTGAPLLDSPGTLAVAAYMALVPMFAGYLLFGYGLARTSASTATTVTLAEPAVAALLAVAVVGERLAPLGWLGLGIIALALVLLAVGSSEEAQHLAADGESASATGTPTLQNARDLGECMDGAVTATDSPS
ncbi:EamA family transporter [Serinibacter salmoneus]|uniref:DME family drug/metabolite transporter n=1 Tax=Serinibacter salmoneus TaxID=556530 RepID=A0A2A9CZ60_9MICO|nr:EamA family transporter [Serinibacter salmoneus]PFG19406.1 DME family drug/metabolite transporter [Serinibacter salmoneus]